MRRAKLRSAVCIHWILRFRPAAQTLAGCGKKAFRTLLSLSVISPSGGELNTRGAERRSELTSPRGANQKGKKPLLSQGAERLFVSQIGFSAPCQGSQHVKYRLRACVAQPVTRATSGFTNGRLLHFPA